ncbi:flavodoxin domain-containing protein [Mycoplasma sp. P36-A1]|uniref:flavodoxin domain-containing protein n=1 Tax=Mycoplasma sp. P36-A1 TaxID=3252900 RepID=UPI003C2E7389
MKYAVRYYSRGGNTQKIAKAIASELQVEAEDIYQPIKESVDYLFLGEAIYANGIDDKIKEFIKNTDPKLVKKVVIFSTSAIKSSAYPQMKKILENANFKVSEKQFHCKGQFSFFHKGRPNQQDLKEAQAFAKQFEL